MTEQWLQQREQELYQEGMWTSGIKNLTLTKRALFHALFKGDFISYLKFMINRKSSMRNEGNRNPARKRRGRPRTSNPKDTHRASMRKASARYYAKNRKKILAKARETHDPVKRRKSYIKWKKNRRSEQEVLGRW